MIEAPQVDGSEGPRSSDVDMADGLAPLLIDMINNNIPSIPDQHFDFVVCGQWHCSFVG
jgi:hypothetical protein